MVTQRVDEYLDCFLPLWFEVYLKKFYLSWFQRCRPSAKRGKFLCFFWLRRQPEGEMNVLCLEKGRNNTTTQQHPPLLFGSVSLKPTFTGNTMWTRKPRDWCGTMTFHCSRKNPLCLWIFFFGDWYCYCYWFFLWNEAMGLSPEWPQLLSWYLDPKFKIPYTWRC